MSEIDNLKSEFEISAEKIKQSGKSLDNDTLLSLYGYYKQATIGDCDTTCPSFWDLKGVAKWEAWNQYKNISKEKAMKIYIKKVTKILEK